MEYVVVFPVVLSVVLALIFSGHVLHQRSVLASSVARGAIVAARTMSDPNYLLVAAAGGSDQNTDIVLEPTGRGDIRVNKPYRYLLGNTEPLPTIEENVRSTITSSQLFATGEPVIEAKLVHGIYQKIILTAKQSFSLPRLPLLPLPSIMELEASNTVYVSHPAELIRNADFAVDVLTPHTEAIANKLKPMFDRVRGFADKVK